MVVSVGSSCAICNIGGLIGSSWSNVVSLDGMNGMGMMSVALSICNTEVVNSRGAVERQVSYLL